MRWSPRRAWHWPSRHPVALDALLAVVLFAATSAAMAASHEGNSREADALAYAIAAAMAALVFARRRWPLGTLIGTTALMLSYHVFDYGGIEPALPLSVALGTAAATISLWWPALIAAGLVAAQLAARLSEVAVLPVLDDVLRDSALLLAVILLGVTVRSRRERLADATARLESERQEQATRAARQAADERLRIAHDVHDIVGHTVAAMTVQAALADDVLETDPAQARRALRAIRLSGREAIAELHATVGSVRSGGPSGQLSPASLDSVDALLEPVREAGLAVQLRRTGTPRAIGSMVDTAAYRIVQESLTNVLKHAGAARVDVTVHYGPEEVTVDVVDDGAGAAVAGPGHGLTGMAERAASVGGTVSAGPAGGGGFAVHAELPVREER